MKSSEHELRLPGLIPQERAYCHSWCDAWVGIGHASSGADPDRILTITRGRTVFRRQVRVPGEDDQEDATSDGEEGDSEATSESAAAVPVRKRPMARKRPAAATDDAPTDKAHKQMQRPAGSSAAVIEPQTGIDCLRHAINNILHSCDSKVIATPQQFLGIAQQLNSDEREFWTDGGGAGYSNRNGYLIEAASAWFRVQHSASCELGDSECVIGALCRPRSDEQAGALNTVKEHFICYRSTGLESWEIVDSLGSTVVPTTAEDALASDASK